MQDLVGGRYRLDEHIGSGGMAEVWRALDVRTGETVALKRLHPSLADDPASRARFLREIDAARAVAHASAVRVRDAGEGPDGVWLVMDHLQGGSLADRLRAGPLSSDEVARIGADIAGALAAVHAAGLLHRDVKPSNILLAADGRARLGDFGIARTEATDGLEDITLVGDVVGTLRFLPPEVLAGESATAASDVWALGAVLYEAIAGRPPFDASSPAALVASQRVLPDLPMHDRAIADQLRAMLDPDPAARPTAAEVGRALAARSTGDASEERTVVIPVPAGRAGVVGVGSVQPRPRALPAEPAQDHGPAGRSMAPVGLLVAVLLAAGLLLALDGPFAGPAGSQGSAPVTGADAAATPSGSSDRPASPTPVPSVSDGGATGAPAVSGKGKGKDKPDKPGKGNGG